MIGKQQKEIGVYWNDIFVYDDGGIHEPTKIYTEGILVESNKNFVLIKNPTTIILSGGRIRNHPHKKVAYYFIPKTTIMDIIHYHDDKTKKRD